MGSGGGGGSSTTVSGIDKEFKPDLQYGLGVSKDLLEDQLKNPGNVVAAFNQQQTDALNASQAAAIDKMQGTGLYDTRAAE